MLDLWSHHRQRQRCIVALLLLGLQQLPLANSGFVDYELLLEPTPEFVHYNDGYVRGPGFIDLGSLVFSAISPAFSAADTDDSTGDDGGGGNRILASPEDSDSVVDVAIFRLPPECAHKRAGCDWTSLGVGKRTLDGSLRWCCNEEAAALNLCSGGNATTYGRLLLVDGKFQGNHREIEIPREGVVAKQMKYGKMEEKESGSYVVLFANCNEYGREILVKGESVWKSVHGYLPGELYGFMFFYISLTVVYFVLWFWYGFAMKVNRAYRIEIEKWVMLAISLGLLEMIFRTLDYVQWNANGYRSTFIILVGVLTGVLKQGISRCLMVMVSLGWGVVRDSLGSTMRYIVVLGAVYIILLATEDFMIIFAWEDVNTLSLTEESKIFNVIRILSLLTAAVNIIFGLWILDALNNTVLYLETMNQTRKLERYNKLRCLFMFSILFVAIRTVFTIVDSVNDEGLVAEEHAWAMDAVSEIIYLFLLVGVAWLWKPNPNAQEYAYVMELPSMGADGDNELELTGVVPSAADSDDGSEDFGNGKNGFHDKNSGFHDDPDDGHDGRFQIS